MEDGGRSDVSVVTRHVSAAAAWSALRPLSWSSDRGAVSFVLFHGSWHGAVDVNRVRALLRRALRSEPAAVVTLFVVLVDASEESLQWCADDRDGPRCPATLPSLAAVVVRAGEDGATTYHADTVDARGVDALLTTVSTGGVVHYPPADDTHDDHHPADHPPVDDTHDDHTTLPCLRLFVSGDRSQVGKSSVCMGLLGTLLALGYDPADLAYVKPATQCEATQLVAAFCTRHGIEAVPVGPIVYYAGFTREFLAGTTAPSRELLARAGAAVDRLCADKRVVLIDGVGYPAVGSVCGTCNGDVATACGYDVHGTRRPAPVLLVGKSGVGDAVDSYNLNASYFQRKHVTVLGAVFNRLQMEGYYSLDNCKTAVTAYFDNYTGPHERPFGFVPELAGMAQARSDDVSMDDLLEAAEEFVAVFGQHVDVRAIVAAAERVREQALLGGSVVAPMLVKRTVPPPTTTTMLTREQIEAVAKGAGAASG